MGSTKEIQTRMKSIQDTMKITNAMYMISSSKMQKAKRILSDTEPYYYNMQAAISRILRHMPDTEHPFFSIRHKIAEEDRKIGCIVVTGDKGMAGAYNHNIQKITEQFMAEHEHCKLYVLGMVGRQYFTKKHMDIAENFPYSTETDHAQSASDLRGDCQSVPGQRTGRSTYFLYGDAECSCNGAGEYAASSIEESRVPAKSGNACGHAAGGNCAVTISRCTSEYHDPQLPDRPDLWMSCRSVCQ